MTLQIYRLIQTKYSGIRGTRKDGSDIKTVFVLVMPYAITVFFCSSTASTNKQDHYEADQGERILFHFTFLMSQVPGLRIQRTVGKIQS
jgi:hypothetical protein